MLLVLEISWKRKDIIGSCLRGGLRESANGLVLLLLFLVIAGLGPILWLPKSARHPDAGHAVAALRALWPNGIDWANLSTAWNDIHIDQYFWNTIVSPRARLGGPAVHRDNRGLRAVGARGPATPRS